MPEAVMMEITEAAPSGVERRIVSPASQRSSAVDAYRGLVMLLMMGEVLQFAAAAKSYPDSLVWHILAPKIPLKRFLIAGILLVISGLLLHATGICPVVKRIWTPSWTLFSGGICFFFLAVFSWVIDVKAHRRWAFPLMVVGMNSIAAYLMAHLWEDFIVDNLHINLGYRVFRVLGPGLEPLMIGIAVLLIYWCILYWMYRRKIFLRI